MLHALLPALPAAAGQDRVVCRGSMLVLHLSSQRMHPGVLCRRGGMRIVASRLVRSQGRHLYVEVLRALC